MAQQLQHVILDQVPHGTRIVVVAGPRADADVLGGGDLYLVDVVAVPQRLEHAVGEPERHHVLHRLLAQVVVDPEDLLLLEHAEHRPVELARLLKGGSEGLLDHHSHVGSLVAVEALFAERLHDHREE